MFIRINELNIFEVSFSANFSYDFIIFPTMLKKGREEEEEISLEKRSREAETLSAWSTGVNQMAYFLPSKELVSHTSTVVKILQRTDKYLFIIILNYEIKNFISEVESAMFLGRELYEYCSVDKGAIKDGALFLVGSKLPLMYNSKKEIQEAPTTFPWTAVGKVKISAVSMSRRIGVGERIYRAQYILDQLLLDIHSHCAWC